MGIPLYTVDAFARERFSGNPAGVCLLRTPRDESWMSAVAREMNLSETAFVLAQGTDFQLRWFTPAVEVDLCGHATLASAHVLWESGKLELSIPARFHTRSGLLTCVRRDDWIAMDFPAKPLAATPVPKELAKLESEERVRTLQPDLLLLRTLPVRGLIVTARAQAEHDFVSRFFAPRVGVPEDPVTGSAHCALGPYWAAKLGKSELSGWQASQRGGEVLVRVEGARVQLSGRALTVVRGELV
jgi:predicted PhzF superfamily epimerase YddE/YHI9